jgi:polyisoprenoid-binding protein YceI
MLLALALFACTTETPEPPAPQVKAEPAPAPKAAELKVAGGQIQLVQLKNGTAEVPAHFETPKGAFKADGTGTFEINVSSWASELELRDTRVRETFFHASEHATATFTVASAQGFDTGIAVGESSTGSLKGELSLYSGKTELEIPVVLSHKEEGTFSLAAQTFQVSIESLGLNENLQALMVECAHESIGDAVDVSFDLTLKR